MKNILQHVDESLFIHFGLYFAKRSVQGICIHLPKIQHWFVGYLYHQVFSFINHNKIGGLLYHVTKFLLLFYALSDVSEIPGPPIIYSIFPDNGSAVALNNPTIFKQNYFVA